MLGMFLGWTSSGGLEATLTVVPAYYIWNDPYGRGVNGHYLQQPDGTYLDSSTGNTGDSTMDNIYDSNGTYLGGHDSCSVFQPLTDASSAFVRQEQGVLGKLYRMDNITLPTVAFTIDTNTQYLVRHAFKFSSNIGCTNAGFTSGILSLTTSTNILSDAVLLVPSSGGTMDANVLKNTGH